MSILVVFWCRDVSQTSVLKKNHIFYTFGNFLTLNSSLNSEINRVFINILQYMEILKLKKLFHKKWHFYGKFQNFDKLNDR